MSPPYPLTHYTATSCLWRGCEATLAALRADRSGLRPCCFEGTTLPTWVGEVEGLEDVRLPDGHARYDCRNNRLAWLGLQQDGFFAAVQAARRRHGAARVAVVLGTSTSGILETEHAYARRTSATAALPAGFDYRGTHNVFALADFVRSACGLRGPAAVVSSACSSGAKACASAARMLDAGLADAVLVGGVDTLCLTTLYGFGSLELLSAQPCRPFADGRSGISIGEAAAFALLERTAPDAGADDVLLCGAGESSDAYHMSSPRPDGLGARLAMQLALEAAGWQPGDVDYVNLHGTATPANDAAEAAAMRALFADRVPAGSTKGATGHTLGAAGAVETVICALALRHGLLPANTGTARPDPMAGLDLIGTPRKAALHRVLNNSFGFGGTNVCLALARRDAPEAA